MNREIQASKKKVDGLYLQVDELRKTLALKKVDTDSTKALSSIEKAYGALETALSNEHQRLTGLVKATSRV